MPMVKNWIWLLIFNFHVNKADMQQIMIENKQKLGWKSRAKLKNVSISLYHSSRIQSHFAPITKNNSSPKAVSGQRCPYPAWVVCDLSWGGAEQCPQSGRSPVEHRGNLSAYASIRPSVCPFVLPYPILRSSSPLGPILTHILPNSPNPSNMAQI